MSGDGGYYHSLPRGGSRKPLSLRVVVNSSGGGAPSIVQQQGFGTENVSSSTSPQTPQSAGGCMRVRLAPGSSTRVSFQGVPQDGAAQVTPDGGIQYMTPQGTQVQYSMPHGSNIQYMTSPASGFQYMTPLSRVPQSSQYVTSQASNVQYFSPQGAGQSDGTQYVSSQPRNVQYMLSSQPSNVHYVNKPQAGNIKYVTSRGGDVQIVRSSSGGIQFIPPQRSQVQYVTPQGATIQIGGDKSSPVRVVSDQGGGQSPFRIISGGDRNIPIRVIDTRRRPSNPELYQPGSGQFPLRPYVIREGLVSNQPSQVTSPLVQHQVSQDTNLYQPSAGLVFGGPAMEGYTTYSVASPQDSGNLSRGTSVVETEETHDLGNGIKCRVRKTHTRQNSRDSDISTTESGASTPKNKNIFARFRFHVGSIGDFGPKAQSPTSAKPKRELFVKDFDDLVTRYLDLRSRSGGESQSTASEPTEEHRCNQDCEYTCHHKCRQLVTLDCANVTADGKYAEKPSRIQGETSLVEDTSQAKIFADTSIPRVVYSKQKSFHPSQDEKEAESQVEKNEAESQTQNEAECQKEAVPEVIYVCDDSDFYVGVEDDAESGYHTGDSTLRSSAHRPSERTLTREDLHKRIESFNHNNHGLVMTLKANTDTFQGFIRVYMNLMRPISMSLSPRPPSIYDVIGSEDSSSESEDTLTTSFYLPKDTTKVIHITSDTTAQEVIRALLQKFKITDNPRKFALYEKVHEEPKKPIMRRLTDEEKPLSLCLSWTAEGLETKRYVLQENDTGEIMWEAFSVPELDNFLRILDREEEEYIEQVKAKYQLMKIQMQQRSKEHERERGFEGDNRQPVFV